MAGIPDEEVIEGMLFYSLSLNQFIAHFGT